MATKEQDQGLPPRGEGDETLVRGLKLQHLRMVTALDDHGQVSAAAQALNMSQPAASRMISEIEAMLGVTLLERLPRGVALTAYGHALARRARAILLEMRAINREIGDLKAGRGGTVSLGAVTAPSIELAMPAIRKLRREHPGIEITMQVETSTVLVRELLASRLDLVIARIPDDLNPRLFESRVIGVEKACLVVRRGHPLAGRSTIRLEDTAEYDWVVQPSGSPLRQAMDYGFLNRNVPLPDRVLHTSSVLLTLLMVAQSDAIAPMSVAVARFIQSSEGLGGAIEILPLDSDFEVRPYSLITVRNRALSPGARTLQDFILREIS
ncbi:MAG: LysR family transcriptional regulator [Rhizobiaceae bacterium]